MKINSKQNELTTNNTVNETNSTEFGISDKGKIAEILRKRLYSKPQQTLVQEYISNARDACVEAGLPLKIIVTMPNSTNKVFKVRDFGTGLSPERMRDVFVNYGSSTKNKDNNQIGGFGIGAKSAWAYTDNFTIVSYYNGVARHYIAHIGKNNMGSLDLINEVATSELNGTEIQIAVAEKDIQTFINAVYRCTYFWDIRPELRGIGPSDIPDWYKTPVNKGSILNVKFYDRNSLYELGGHENFLVIDGIPYPLTYQFNDNCFLDTDLKYCIFLKTGQVEVSASRETITDNEESQENLKNIFDNLNKNILEFIKDKLTKSENLAEFLQQYKFYKTVYSIGNQVYKQYTQENNGLNIDGQLPKFNNIVLKLEKTSQGDKYRLDSEENNWNKVYNYHFLYTNKEINKATLYNKVKTFLNQFPDSGLRQAIVVYPWAGDTTDQFNTFVADIKAINLSTIELEKKVVQKKPVNELKVTVVDGSRRYRNGHDTITLDLNTNTEYWIYMVKDNDFTNQKNTWNDLIQVVKNKFNLNVCFIAESNLKKVEKNDNFLTYEQFMNNPYKFLKVNIKDELLNEKTGDIDTLVDSYEGIDFNQIKDKELVNILNKYKGKERKYYGYYKHNKIWDKIKQNYLEESQELKNDFKIIEKETAVLNRYPLVQRRNEETKPECLWYINTKFKEKYE